jgi:hypothetical protein
VPDVSETPEDTEETQDATGDLCIIHGEFCCYECEGYYSGVGEWPETEEELEEWTMYDAPEGGPECDDEEE